MRHFENNECRFFQEEKILKPSHSTIMRELRPMPTTPKAMRHFEKTEDRLFRSENILKPSHSAIIRELRRMPTTPRAMRHFEKTDKSGGKPSQIVSFSQTLSLPPKVERAWPVLRYGGRGESVLGKLPKVDGTGAMSS